MSYTHKLSNMSSTWIFIFGVGNTIGAMSMQPIGTMLVFSDNPLSFMWLLTGLALTALLSFIGMYLLGYKYGPLPQGKSFSLKAYRVRPDTLRNKNKKICQNLQIELSMCLVI